MRSFFRLVDVVAGVWVTLRRQPAPPICPFCGKQDYSYFCPCQKPRPVAVQTIAPAALAEPAEPLGDVDTWWKAQIDAIENGMNNDTKET